MKQEHKNNISKALRGRKLTKEWKQKISKSHKGLLGPNRGKKFSEEHKRKISESNKGKKRSLETRKKNRLAMIGKNGEKAPNWQGGIFKDKEYKKKKYQKWIKNNYEKKLWHNNQRRIKKLGSKGSHTLGEWETLKAQYNWTCPCCRKSEPKIKLSEDHIIPLSKGGSDDIENIQPLCRSCNSKKYTKIIKHMNYG